MKNGRRYIAGRDRDTSKAGRCRRRHCDTLLKPEMGANGVVTYTCEPCSWNAKGLCRDCHGPLVILSPHSLPLRCPDCRRKHHTKLHLLHYYMDVEKARAAKRAQTDRMSPERKAKRNRYYRDYHRERATPPDEFSRLYKRVWQKGMLADPTKNAKHNAHRRAYALEKRKQAILAGTAKPHRKRDYAWLREAGILPITTQVTRSSSTGTASISVTTFRKRKAS